MYCCLFATTFNKFRNGPMAALDASGHSWRHSQRAVRFAEVVIREIERNRSLKVFQFLAESIR